MSNSAQEPDPLQTSNVLLGEFEAIFGTDKVDDVRVAIAGLEYENARLKEVRARAVQLAPVALCLSGGGIRSASFGLGVLQALAEAGLLTRFHYLSTVSGGGYIGSWLSAWLRWAGSCKPVMEGLSASGDAEPLPIRHIRQYSNYLTPKVGFMSGDTWAAVAIYVRNLVLNWMILFPALWLCVLFPKIASAAAQLARANPLPEIFGWSIGALISLLVIVSTWYTTANRTSERSLCFFGLNAQISFIAADLFPLVLAGTAFTWVVNRPLDCVGWLIQDYWGLALVALGAAVLYAVGFSMAFLAHQNTSTGPSRVQWVRDAAAWILSGLIAGKVLWFGATGYVALPDLMTLVPSYCTGAETVCAAGQGTMTQAIKLDAKSLLVVVGMPYFLLAALTGQLVFVLLRSYSPRGDFEREWLGRAAGWYIVIALGWVIGATLVLFASAAAAGASLVSSNLQAWLAPLGGVSGALAALLGKSSTTPRRGRATGWQATVANIALGVAGAVFGAVMIIGSSILIDQVVFGKSLQNTLLFLYKSDPNHPPSPAETAEYGREWTVLLLSTVGLLAFWAAVSWFVNPNRFSLHALYRNRLIRAFLGGPHLVATEPRQRRRPNLFTGFDEHDNLRMTELWPAARLKGEWRPFHVINITLNVVSGRNLAWQQRKAEPFVATPLACGCHDAGYRPTRYYGNRGDAGISLGTAMAISGAAASPNMGYHSSPLVTLLLAVLNVRLGWWLGNPGKAGARTYGKDGPDLAFGPFFAELFGLTTDSRRYVYLSDGGHFENLGLYEMIRRRCAVMVVSDAGQDGEYDFADLGNAVRKIRIDLGVRIEFPPLETFRRPDPAPPGWERPVFIIGTVHYPEPGAPPGKILYLKPGLRGGEPADVLAYAREFADFPHQSTDDQWFDEPQFESYRALGRHTMSSVVTNLIELFDAPAARSAGSADQLPAHTAPGA
jgi:Patatin-like phospholipase